MDARYEKVRIEKRVLSQGVLIIIGIGKDGYREILTVEIANTETKESRGRVFKQLKQRGLTGVKLVVSDDHEGLRAAVNRYFQGGELAEMSGPFLSQSPRLYTEKGQRKGWQRDSEHLREPRPLLCLCQSG